MGKLKLNEGPVVAVHGATKHLHCLFSLSRLFYSLLLFLDIFFVAAQLKSNRCRPGRAMCDSLSLSLSLSLAFAFTAVLQFNLFAIDLSALLLLPTGSPVGQSVFFCCELLPLLSDTFSLCFPPPLRCS